MAPELVKEMNQLKRMYSPLYEGVELEYKSAKFKLAYWLMDWDMEYKKRKDAGFSHIQIVEDSTMELIYERIEKSRAYVKDLFCQLTKMKRLAYLISVYKIFDEKRNDEPIILNHRYNGKQLNLW
jgi:hypothetical protein